MEPGYFIGVMILAVVCWYIGEPLVMGVHNNKALAGTDGKTLLNLSLRKEEVMLTLKDLEMDFKMKKISEEDYRLLYKEAVQQGSLLVQQIEAEKQCAEKPTANESAINKSARKFCTQCGSALPTNAKFCGECGQKK